eukprot:1944592-Rhodomonas_salina.2
MCCARSRTPAPPRCAAYGSGVCANKASQPCLVLVSALLGQLLLTRLDLGGTQGGLGLSEHGEVVEGLAALAAACGPRTVAPALRPPALLPQAASRRRACAPAAGPPAVRRAAASCSRARTTWSSRGARAARCHAGQPRARPPPPRRGRTSAQRREAAAGASARGRRAQGVCPRARPGLERAGSRSGFVCWHGRPPTLVVVIRKPALRS